MKIRGKSIASRREATRSLTVRGGKLESESSSIVYFVYMWRRFGVEVKEDMVRIYPDKNGKLAYIFRDGRVVIHLPKELDGKYKWFFEDFDVIGDKIVPKTLVLVPLKTREDTKTRFRLRGKVIVEKKGRKVETEKVEVYRAYTTVRLNSFVVREWERKKYIVIKDREVVEALRGYDGYDVVRHGEMYFVMFMESGVQRERKHVVIRIDGMKPGVYTWTFLPDEAWVIIAPQEV